MTKFNIPDMSCGHCKAAITEALTKADAAIALEFDMQGRSITVESTLDETAIAEILANSGYPATFTS